MYAQQDELRRRDLLRAASIESSRPKNCIMNRVEATFTPTQRIKPKGPRVGAPHARKRRKETAMSAYAADGRGEVRARGGGAAPGPAARYTDSSMSRKVRGRSAQSERAASKSTFVVTSQALMAATRPGNDLYTYA